MSIDKLGKIDNIDELRRNHHKLLYVLGILKSAMVMGTPLEPELCGRLANALETEPNVHAVVRRMEETRP